MIYDDCINHCDDNDNVDSRGEKEKFRLRAASGGVGSSANARGKRIVRLTSGIKTPNGHCDYHHL